MVATWDSITSRRRALAFILMATVAVGCSRSAEDAELEGDNLTPAPTAPSPTTELPPDAQEDMNEVTREMPAAMSECSGYWDGNSLYSYLYGAYGSGYYTPFSYGPGLVTPRGMKRNNQRGFACANSLMYYSALLNQLSPYFGPNVLGSYLQNTWGWAYSPVPGSPAWYP